MKYEESILKKLNKSELIKIILDSQSTENSIEKSIGEMYPDKILKFCIRFEGGEVKVSLTVKVHQNVLDVKWRKLTPSGYSDNGIGGSYDIVLDKKQISEIKSEGYTSQIILKILKLRKNFDMLAIAYANQMRGRVQHISAEDLKIN